MKGRRALIFSIGGERCALPATSVERVVQAVAVTPLPGAPPLVLGAMDVAGDVLPVLDLRGRMALPPREIHAADQMVIVRTGLRTVVLPIDEVEQVVDLDLDEFGGTELAATSRAPLLGVLRLADGMVWIHDLERLFSSAESGVFDRALAVAEPFGGAA